MEIYIVDGTYELFRAHFGYPVRIIKNKPIETVKRVSIIKKI